MDKPLVSVIVPVYNTGDSVKKTIDSILHNTYKNIEIIIVNDGSTDDTRKLLNKIKSIKVKIYDKKNGGPSSARNFGIGKAKGKYLLFVDSDDEVELDFIEKLVKEIELGDKILAMSGVLFKYSDEKKKIEFTAEFSRKNGEDIKSYILRSLLKDGRMYPVFNKIFRSDIVKSGVRFDEKMWFGEDTKFVLDYVGRIDGPIGQVLKPLYVHNMNTETSVAKTAERDWNNWKKCYKSLKNWTRGGTIRQRVLVGLLYLKWRYTWLKSL